MVYEGKRAAAVCRRTRGGEGVLFSFASRDIKAAVLKSHFRFRRSKDAVYSFAKSVRPDNEVLDLSSRL